MTTPPTIQEALAALDRLSSVTRDRTIKRQPCSELVTTIRLALEAAALEAEWPAWVAVGERMPEDGQHVFFFTSWLDICQGRFDAGGKRMFNEKVGSWDIGAVTHWMPRRVDPLPSPPEST